MIDCCKQQNAITLKCLQVPYNNFIIELSFPWTHIKEQ